MPPNIFRNRADRLLLAFDNTCPKSALFGETGRKDYLCRSKKRKGAGSSSFRVFRGKLSYMSVKIILYDRKNYQQARKNLLLYNFPEILESENFLDFRRNFLGANFPFLNYP